METKKVNPRKLAGFMELLPQKQLIFDEMKSTIENTFKNNCFLPLDTPVLELSEVLLAKSGGEIDKEVYHFTKGDSSLCMRYDLTVPLARFVAANFDSLTFPFKRYQIGKVYRGERPQKGRFREFYQCDADIIGNEQLPIAADAECVSLLAQIFNNLKLDVQIKISNRNLLFGLIESLGCNNLRSEILILLDKINKIGKDNLVQTLKDYNINEKAIKLLVETVCLSGDFETVLTKLNTICDNELYQKGIAELTQLYTYLKGYGVSDKQIVLDAGIIRGQDYYTGTIFEAYLTKHPEFGAIGAGGRYDNLATYFTDRKLPGVGMSIGLTRLFDVLSNCNMLPQTTAAVEVEIVPLGDTLPDCLAIETKLRNAGIKAETNYDNRSFKAKLKEANKREIHYIMIIGEDEIKNQTYALKDMTSGEQETLTLDDCIKKISKR